ncbi:unnamed protein product [Caenorhabditis bovis]|uniref:Methylated-DNA--protein-cysteine methyltransferase n=1 Tax=Caenorhabditis bovis TaxID=2654633 RepID=A0A8S1F2R4_9PELO|nr:unnamed protein product [Caenorhabditis bovis]
MKIVECAYQIVESDYGSVLIAECSTSKRVIAVYFVRDVEDDIKELQETFPTVNFKNGICTNSGLVVDAINRLEVSSEIPLHIKCETQFGKQVVDALQKIPKGETRTYSQIARELGNPNAARAVARVCSTNNIAYIIPCHRVIASNGAISGYRWGIEKKRELLNAEGAIISFAVM